MSVPIFENLALRLIIYASFPLQFYQLIGHSIRVMAESIEDVEERTIPVLGPKASTSRDPATAPSPNKSVSKAFDNFQSPSKKKRL